jgi:hypothetical protein
MLCTVLSLSLSFCCTFHYTHPFASFSRTLQFARPVAAGSRSAWVAKPKPNSRYARLRRIRRSSFQSSCACVCSILYALYCALSLFLLCFTFYSHAYSSLASFSRTLQYFIGDTEVAQSLEDADCCCRIFCSPIHPFKMRVQELSTDAELLTVDRPTRCAAGGCKCCCYQEISVSSGGQELGNVKEDCYYCVPAFTVTAAGGEELYKIHPPTCCGGMCMNCCAEGNPCCGKGCCKVPFWVFNAGQANTNGDAPHIGKILKKPKSLGTELLTDANAFTIDFPEQATADEKALLVGTSIFLNAMFFEGDN